MKKSGSTSSCSKVMDQLVDMMDSLSLDEMTSVVQNNATDQHFSIRQYVADTRETDPKACNPFGEKNHQIWQQLKAPLNVPQFKWGRCTNCVRDHIASGGTPALPGPQETSHGLNAQISTLQLCASAENRASEVAEEEGSKVPIEGINLDSDAEGEGTKAPIEVINIDSDAEEVINIESDAEGEDTNAPIEVINIDSDAEGEGTGVINLDDSDAEGEGSKAPIEVINLDDTDDEGELQKFGRLEELATMALLLEKESAEGQGCISLGEAENANRPSPFSQNTDLTPRKRSKVTGESSRCLQDKQKKTVQTSSHRQDCIIPADARVSGPQEKNCMIPGKDLNPKKNKGKRPRDAN